MTKLNVRIGIVFLLVFLTALFTTLEAQSRSRNSRSRSSREPEKFTDNIWYGGGFNLGFSGSNLGSLSGNSFFVGISPMAGYKLFKNFSAGPRLEIQYLTGRYRDRFSGSQTYKYNVITYGVGAFMRYKLFPFLFTHVEYDYLSREVPTDQIIQNKSATERYGDSLFLLGGGYTSGGEFSTEIYILYDVLDDGTSLQLPIQYRFGFTYRF